MLLQIVRDFNQKGKISGDDDVHDVVLNSEVNDDVVTVFYIDHVVLVYMEINDYVIYVKVLVLVHIQIID